MVYLFLSVGLLLFCFAICGSLNGSACVLCLFVVLSSWFQGRDPKSYEHKTSS